MGRRLEELPLASGLVVRPAKVCPAEVHLAEVHPAEVRPAEVRPADVGPAEVEALQVAAYNSTWAVLTTADLEACWGRWARALQRWQQDTARERCWHINRVQDREHLAARPAICCKTLPPAIPRVSFVK